MRLGLVTPVLTLNPRAHNEWEETAGFDDVVAVAEAADRLGWHHITCSEHVAVPRHVAPTRGSRYWDPLATFGYLAARTERLRLATHVLVLGYHHPLAIAKRYGTLDRIAGGRLILGVGVGSLQEEFELLGAPFDDRGDRGDDAIRALRASFGRREPSYRGPHYAYDGFVVDPHAAQDDVPIWIGGRTGRSLRRAVELGDAWVPFGLTLDEEKHLLERARQTEAWAARDRELELVLYAEGLDPLGDPARAREALERRADAGATAVNVRLVHSSLTHCLEQLAAMVEIAR
jgi:probable F420-dependent oxidoreductase